jgi:imidazolonepropionase-like amidohydrolase
VTAAAEPALAEDRFAVVGAKVFDGERARAGLVVEVEGERIVRLADADGYAAPAGTQVVEGAGHTLLPGLIDSHTHPLRDVDLRQSLVFGVTTSLSMMNRPELAQQVKAAQAKGEGKDLADLFGAGNPVTCPGGHGTQYGIPIPTVQGVDQIAAFVAARVKEGSDFIKVMYEHGDLYEGEVPGLSEAELKAAVAAAHAHEKLAVVHVSSLAEGLAAFDAGADGLVHMWMDAVPSAEDLVRPWPAGKPFVVPTLAVIEGIERAPGAPAPIAEVPAFRPYLVPANLTNLRRSWVGLKLKEGAGLAVASRGVKALFAAGYPILAGSDAPNPGVTHGVSLHRELELLVAAGLTPVQALVAATSAPADAFGLEDRGRIAPGLRADLLLVKGDPTRDVLATREIARVWKAGAEYPRAVYAAAVADDVARLKALPAPANLGEGLVADFEAGALAPRFGGFFPSTDAIRGGDSRVVLTLGKGGAGESKHCLRAEGTVTETAKPFRWASVFFAPGLPPMAPANLSSRGGVRFRVRGSGPLYLGVMAERLGILPVIRRLPTGDDWQDVRYTWDELDGLDGTDVTGILFGADAPGDFWLELDDMRFD